MLKLFAPIMLRASQTPPAKLVGAAKTGGRSASGIVANSRSDGGGLWTFARAGIPIKTADELRYWNLMSAYLLGGSTPIIVPICESRTAPFPVVDGERVFSYDQLPHDDETLFDDDTGYDQPVIDVDVNGAHSLRATSIAVHLYYGTPFRGGELFSILHPVLSWRLYRVVNVEEVVEDSNYTLTIEPPLREDVADDTVLEFDQPKCVMQLESMDVPVELLKFANASISFVESFLPLE